MKQCNLSGKTVLPFCTHGGGGSGHIEEDMQALSPQAKIQKIFEVYGNGGARAGQAVSEWIGGIRS